MWGTERLKWSETAQVYMMVEWSAVIPTFDKIKVMTISSKILLTLPEYYLRLVYTFCFGVILVHGCWRHNGLWVWWWWALPNGQLSGGTLAYDLQSLLRQSPEGMYGMELISIYRDFGVHVAGELHMKLSSSGPNVKRKVKTRPWDRVCNGFS